MITLPADASSHRHRGSQCPRRSAVYDQQVCRTSRRAVRIGTCRICTVSLSWRSMLHVIGANNLTPPQIRARGCTQAHHTRRRPPSPSNITDLASQPHADPESALHRSRGRRSADQGRLSSLVRSKGPSGSDLACIPEDGGDTVATAGERRFCRQDIDRRVRVLCLRSLLLLEEDIAV